jgi:hypothetical protein
VDRTRRPRSAQLLWTFFTAVLAGRLIRFGVFVALAARLLG